ncbi:hypothetical protein E6C60_1578 [Paenibacillus algicola]|uniref:Uncharacterized protein n=1 Tax=Paenibacillus algicola TaxID=2565926 RepID=A0A4V1G3T3_9BACL|nr:hypothetical protein E6C60_1578 [Paenibacillus algicola]
MFITGMMIYKKLNPSKNAMSVFAALYPISLIAFLFII